jgi:hypothetical protein
MRSAKDAMNSAFNSTQIALATANASYYGCGPCISPANTLAMNNIASYVNSMFVDIGITNGASTTGLLGQLTCPALNGLCVCSPAIVLYFFIVFTIIHFISWLAFRPGTCIFI